MWIYYIESFSVFLESCPYYYKSSGLEPYILLSKTSHLLQDFCFSSFFRRYKQFFAYCPLTLTIDVCQKQEDVLCVLMRTPLYWANIRNFLLWFSKMPRGTLDNSWSLQKKDCWIADISWNGLNLTPFVAQNQVSLWACSLLPFYIVLQQVHPFSHLPLILRMCNYFESGVQIHIRTYPCSKKVLDNSGKLC